jgi:RNA polymerase-associated protein CTR9
LSAQAIVAFERVLKQCPDNYETQKILASLYAHADTLSPGATTTSSGADGAAHEKREAERRERRQLARELFAKVVVQEPDDAEAWIDYAQLLEEIDGRRALHAYATAVRLVADAVGADAAPELHINMGSLHSALGELDEALACFERALVIIDADLASAESVADDAATSQAPADDLRPLRVTCAYNLARVCEALCDFTRAETLYKEITANNPKYVDCTLCSTCVRACESAGYIRLGAMARNRGQLHDASSWWKEALSVDLVRGLHTCLSNELGCRVIWTVGRCWRINMCCRMNGIRHRRSMNRY